MAESKHPYPESIPATGKEDSVRDARYIAINPSAPTMLLMASDRKYYCVYIIGSLSGTLYIGFSGNLHRCIFQHKAHHFEGFSDKHEVTLLLYWESYDGVHKALVQETQLKGWKREKKIALIVKKNPHWLDLAADWYPWMKSEWG